MTRNQHNRSRIYHKQESNSKHLNNNNKTKKKNNNRSNRQVAGLCPIHNPSSLAPSPVPDMV